MPFVVSARRLSLQYEHTPPLAAGPSLQIFPAISLCSGSICPSSLCNGHQNFWFILYHWLLQSTLWFSSKTTPSGDMDVTATWHELIVILYHTEGDSSCSFDRNILHTRSHMLSLKHSLYHTLLYLLPFGIGIMYSSGKLSFSPSPYSKNWNFLSTRFSYTPPRYVCPRWGFMALSVACLAMSLCNTILSAFVSIIIKRHSFVVFYRSSPESLIFYIMNIGCAPLVLKSLNTFLYSLLF